MDQMKTGKFIADMRKAQGLTQKELAEKLGLSDKTISKWECGNGMPDNSIMLELCDILHISVNELLSGERLSSENYSQKAEENIMNLIQNTDANERNNKRSFISTLVGVMALILVIWFIIITSGGMAGILWFADFTSLVIIMGTSIIMLLSTGTMKDFCYAFRYFCKTDATVSKQELIKSYAAIKLVMLTTMLGGILGVITPFIVVLHSMDSPYSLGPNISVMCICIFYSAIIDLLLLPIAFRLKAKITE